MRYILLCGLAALSICPVNAEPLTLERVFADPALDGPSPRELQLSPDGGLATFLRNRDDDAQRFDLWAVDAATGQSRMLVDSEALGTGAELSEEELMRRERARLSGVRGIVNYQWSPDGETILVPLDGDIYLAEPDGEARRLTETEATELDAQVSQTGRYVSFVRDSNLYRIDVETGDELRLTPDGGEAISWGVAEFVAQEEMSRTVGHWWSPDDRHLVAARVDESPVELVTRTAIGAEGTRVFEQRYPVAGSANAIVDLFVLTPDGETRTPIDLGEDNDIYIARVDWSADGSTIFVQRQSRDQRRLDMLAVDPATGASEILFTETAESWINLHDNLRPLDDGSLIWSSQRDGFSHIYHWRDGTWRQLTRGEWEVEDVLGIDSERGRIYFTGNRNVPIEQHVYWVDMNDPGEPVQVTEDGWWNEAVMNDSATGALIFRSNSDQPRQVYLADAEGRTLAQIEENALAGDHPYAPYLDSHRTPAFGTIEAEDGTPLYYRMITPELEPGHRYPVFVQVYGGPGVGRQARQIWARQTPLQQYLVDQGWIVFSIDNRGSPNRGKVFEDHINRAMGTVEVTDQLAGLDWLQAQPFVNPERIGVYGWSYGGYMVLHMLQAAPGRFAAGVSGAPVTRWELYDTHYTERYLGNPTIDPRPYERGNPVTNAEALADPLLLIHGMADDNVIFEHSTVYMGRLQEAAIPFELMVYPGATHRVSGEERQVHMWRTITDFLDRHVRGER